MGLWALALVIVAVRWPGYLVHAAVICSVFEGAALVNAGGLGISPYYFALMLIPAQCLFVRVTRGNALGHSPGVRRIIACALVLLVLGLVSAIAMPVVFAGWPVLSPRLSADAKAPLEFSTSNIGQSVYLLLNVIMLWYTAQTCRTPAAARGLMNAFLIAGLIVIGFAVYQLAASLLGIPFPDDILYSNDAYVMQHGTAILNMPRLCSTYTEPSSLAVFLVAFIFFLITVLDTGTLRWTGAALLIAAITALVLSTSSTAYLGLAAITSWAVLKYIFLPIVHGSGNMKATLAVCAAIGAAVWIFSSNASLRDVVVTSVFEKDQSSSYEERSQADTYSMQLAANTWGLGVGLGSNRASSFLPSVLSTLGVLGAGALAALVWSLVRAPDMIAGMKPMHRPLSLGLIGIVGAKMISSPDMATPTLWALMAALISVRAAAESPIQQSVTTVSSDTPADISRPQVSFG
jgi:hypothetical protein